MAAAAGSEGDVDVVPVHRRIAQRADLLGLAGDEAVKRPGCQQGDAGR